MTIVISFIHSFKAINYISTALNQHFDFYNLKSGFNKIATYLLIAGRKNQSIIKVHILFFRFGSPCWTGHFK